MVNRPAAFTLIELLVVVAIISLLAGMLLAVAGPARDATRKAKTNAILGSIRTAIATAGAERGGSIAAAEHPLAGSAVPRPRFLRLASPFTPVAQSGEALRVSNPEWVPGAFRTRVLLDDDRFAGGGSLAGATWELPLLYGMPRGRIGVPGTADERISQWRNLPKPSSRFDLNGDGLLDISGGGPDPAMFDNGTFRIGNPVEDRAVATRRAIEALLGGGVLSEVTKLGAVVDGPTTAPAIANAMVVSMGTRPQWERGCLLDGTGIWHKYRFLGTSLVDAWGTEILFSATTGGAIRLESAGKDGVFRWDPGSDRAYATASTADVASGDDRDGSLDNIASATGE